MSHTENDGRMELGQDREEVGSSAESRKHPPHLTENAENAELNRNEEEAPVMPANASGTDKVPTDEQDTPVDDESMYDGRPEEHKDDHPR